MWSETARINNLVTEKFTAIDANITNLSTEVANVKTLVAKKASIGELSAVRGDVEALRSGNSSFSKISTSSLQMYSGGRTVTMGVVVVSDNAGNSYYVPGCAV